MSDFYLTLPSHSSTNEFPYNASNSFNIRLPHPIRLEGSGWKGGLAAISLPDLKNVLPHWLDETKSLFYNTLYHAWRSGASNKRFLSASFKVSDVDDILDL